MQISDLSPGTAYLVKVQALGDDGNQGVSSLEEQFETLSEGSGRNRSRKNLLALFGNLLTGLFFLQVTLTRLLLSLLGWLQE